MRPRTQKAAWAIRLYSEISDRVLRAVSPRRRRIRDLLEAIATEICSWPGVVAQPHQMGGIEFLVGGVEVGHYHGDGTVDVPFTKPIKRRLLNLGRAREHRYAPGSGVVSFFVAEAADSVGALSLLELSYLQKALWLSRRVGRRAPLPVDELRVRLVRLETDRELLAMLDGLSGS